MSGPRRDEPCLHCRKPVEQPTNPQHAHLYCGPKCRAAGPAIDEGYDEVFERPYLKRRHTDSCIAAVYRGGKGCTCTPTPKPEATP